MVNTQYEGRIFWKGIYISFGSIEMAFEIQNNYLLVRKTEVYIQICNWIKCITCLLLQILLLLTHWCRSPTRVPCFFSLFAQVPPVPRQGSVQKHCSYCLVTKSCLTLCYPTGHSPPVSSVLGISQARILEWVAILFSRGSSQPRDWTDVSCISRWILNYWATREAPQA